MNIEEHQLLITFKNQHIHLTFYNSLTSLTSKIGTNRTCYSYYELYKLWQSVKALKSIDKPRQDEPTFHGDQISNNDGRESQ